MRFSHFSVSVLGEQPSREVCSTSVSLKGLCHRRDAHKFLVEAIRLATSIGLAATGSIASSVTQQFSSAHPTARHTEALLAGYRAAGWFCTGCSAFSIILSFLFLGKMGVVGKTDEQTRDTSPRPTLSDSTRQLNGTSLNATPRRSTEQNSLNDIPMEHLDRKK